MQRIGAILIIESDAVLRAFLAEALDDEGYTVRTAYDAETALDSIRQHPPDLVLLDLQTPGKTTMRLLAALQRNRTAGSAVVALTTNTQVADALSAQDVAACLVMPFDLDDLLNCVAKHIR